MEAKNSPERLLAKTKLVEDAEPIAVVAIIKQNHAFQNKRKHMIVYVILLLTTNTPLHIQNAHFVRAR
jgi:hypothetical protein